MKIGILTFHSQLNYGGVLQAYALQETLREMGHDVVIVDRWLDCKNSPLEQGYSKLGVLGWGDVCLRSLLGGWELAKYRRIIKTKRFLRDCMRLSPYHFCKWCDAPVDMGLDAVVVGSDQVWLSGKYSDPGPYLLEDAPRMSAISYAASFGMTGIPEGCRGRYETGLHRFSRISCREAEGVAICKTLGFDAAHVVDPTLLLGEDEWRQIAGVRKSGSVKRLVCYFMDVDVSRTVEELDSFACRSGFAVEVFLDARFFLPFPRTVAQLRSRFRRHEVKFRIDAGPEEFVKAFAGADFVLTDSFHALMFSSIFGCNLRFLRPSNAFRRGMFSRIDEFVDEGTYGPVFSEGVVAALDSFAKDEKMTFRRDWIDNRRRSSLEWLRMALQSACCEHGY